jgi:hypothetical protein
LQFESFLDSLQPIRRFADDLQFLPFEEEAAQEAPPGRKIIDDKNPDG